MKNLRFCSFSIILMAWLFFIFGINFANANPLSIRISSPTQVAGDMFYSVFLDGDIDNDAPARLNEIIKKIPEHGAINFHINSNGGSLFASMELGRIFRRLGASTSISKRISDGGNATISGVCYSACSLAYLGGLYRYADSGTIYGVHRISRNIGPTKQDLDVGQIASAAVSSYLSEMGIDSRLFKLMASTDAMSMYILSMSEMKMLRVANNGRSPSEWEVKVIPGGYYLRGQQDTYYGFGKIVLSCIDGGVVMMSFYSAGEKSSIIAKGGWVHALRVGDKELPLHEPKPPNIYKKDDMIISSFALSKLQVSSILKEKSIGHSMKPSPTAAVYVGYDIDIEEGDRLKVRDYLSNCK